MFGQYIKELRSRKRIGLREFCTRHGHDPSNWSKIERGILPPPRDDDTLSEWARQLELVPGTPEWYRFIDYAAVDAGRIPPYLLEDKDLVAKLPAFFRTLSGKKPSEEDLLKLMEIIRSTQTPG
jgi:transcriptional regulator with XRE-family HTH domain